MSNTTDHIFALDIGTRSVVGLILKQENQKFKIIDMFTKEHHERSMLDGQIHDVLSVSNVIQEVKHKLEGKHGPLKKVCVAAAGRALKTQRESVSVNITGKPLMNEQDIIHLELTAVQKAQFTLANEEQEQKSNRYYCVGYSVLRYRLDGDEIGNLVDQQGDEASIEIIATFLPKVVVESLLAALERADLEMSALTLEPIAAINVLIPPSMRRLNVALVDIGAGTSDIAITDLGTIIAYGMVPIAGDEITEAISDQFLLDFPYAEKAKRELHHSQEITIQDILGFESTIHRHEVVEKIENTLDKLASEITSEILTLNNNKAPKAVMLVGGGSLTPELPRLLSNNLGLPNNRVAIRGIDAIQKLELAEHIEQKPELVTPIGIAIAASLSPVHYVTVYVNDKAVRLFDIKKLTIGDCLIAAGIEMNKLYGKPGMALFITVNGNEVTLPGGHGEAPTLLKNGENAQLDDRISNNDRIEVKKGSDGKSPSLQIKDLVEERQKKEIWINNLPYEIESDVLQNNKKVPFDTFIRDNDEIVLRNPRTIKELFVMLDHDEGLKSIEPFYVYLNRFKVSFDEYDTHLFKNGKEVKPNTLIDDGDHITLNKGTSPAVKNLLELKNLSLHYQIPIVFNGKQVTLKKQAMDIFRNGEELLKEDSKLKLGDKIQTVNKKVEPFIFQDIFRYVDIKMPNMQSGKFILLRNGNETSFHEQLTPGDELEIYWPDATED